MQLQSVIALGIVEIRFLDERRTLDLLISIILLLG